MIRDLFLMVSVAILVCVGFGVLVQVLTELSEAAKAGNAQATCLIPVLVFGALGLLGLLGWRWTVKTGKVPEL